MPLWICLHRAVVGALLAVGAVAAGAADGPPLLAPLAGAAEAPPAPWHVVGLPGQTKPFTRFSAVNLDGQRVLRVEAQASYGNLVHPVAGNPPAHRLSWRWRVDEASPGSDLKTRAGDDSPAKVCALFDLPIEAVPFVERQVLKLARLRSAEPLPAASVCYVWDGRLAPGTVLDNAFTRRIRIIVLRGPEAGLHGWQSEQRDIHADFLRLFGDESRTVPPLMGIGVAADADNTQGHSLAHMADIALQ